MPGRTSHYSLSTMGAGDRFSEDGYKHVGADRVLMDSLIHRGAESHVHDGALGSALTPTDPLQLSALTTGGTLPAGTTIYYKWTYVNPDGEESVPSPEAFVTTPNPVESPSAPTLSSASTGGLFGGGNYFYVLSAYVTTDNNETRALNPTYMTVPSTTSTNVITLTLPELPAGADGFNLYRRRPGQAVYYWFDSIDMDVATPPTEYEDDGSIEEDCDRTLPRFNTTNATNSVEIELPVSVPALPDGYHWRIYRTYVNTDWANSVLHDVVEYTVEATPVITTIYTDIGISTTSGTYPETNLLINNPSKILLTDGAEVQGFLPQSMVEDLAATLAAIGGGGVSVVTIAASNSSAGDLAIADYVCDGVNDQVEIQAAVDSFGVGGNYGVVLFASGYYVVGGAVDITNSTPHIEFRGAVDAFNNQPTQIERVSGTEPIFDESTATTGRTRKWKNLSLWDFDTVTTTAPLVNLGANSAHWFERCILENDNTNAGGGACVRANAGMATINIKECEFYGEGHNLVSTGVRIVLEAEATLFSPYGAANSDVLNFTTMSASSLVWLKNCWAEGGSVNGYRIDGNTGSLPMPDVRIIGGNCFSFGGEAVYVTDISYLRIENVGNLGDSVENGIRASNEDGGVIQSNRLLTPDKHGIWLLDCDSVQIIDNDVIDASNGTDNTYSGIILDGNTNDCVIKGNQIRATAANKALYGIRIDDSTCDNNTIANNDLRGSCKTTGNEVSDLGTNTQGAEVLIISVSSEATPLVTLAPAVSFRMPFPMCLTKVRGSLSIASGSGNPTFDINDSGTTILSTKLTIDVGEKTSTTAAVPAVISDPALADDAEITVDVDAAGSGARGAKVSMYGWRI